MSADEPLSDQFLLERFVQNLGKLKFPDDITASLKKACDELMKLAAKGDDFSIFSVSSRELGQDRLRLHDIWQQALVGSIASLRWYDRRENSDRKLGRGALMPDVGKLSDYYKEAAKFERLLYGADPYYRDHFAHALRVWWLGLHVIFDLAGGKIAHVEFVGNEELDERLCDAEELYAAYSVAALTHDLGYPLEKVGKLNAAVGKILDSFGGIDWSQLKVAFSLQRYDAAQQLLRFLASKPVFIQKDGPRLRKDEAEKFVEYMLDSYDKDLSREERKKQEQTDQRAVCLRIQWKYYQKFFDSLEEYDHGFLSALLLQRKLLYFKEAEFALEEDFQFTVEEARQFMVRREIVRAIATHTCSAIYLLDLTSVSSLLFFCDEIQEWGRPFFSDLYGGVQQRVPRVVTLKEYNQRELCWTLDVGELRPEAAAHWLRSAGEKLLTRLRPAPEFDQRRFKLSWALAWSTDNVALQADFEFNREGAQETMFCIARDTEIVDILGFIKSLALGKDRDEVDKDLVDVINKLGGAKTS